MAEKSHKNRCVCVYDYGLFVELAVLLAREFGRVLYYVPWEGPYPKSNTLMIGAGVEGIEKVSSFWPYFDEIELFVFPDLYQSELQEFLVSRGKRVWGARFGEEIELDRVYAKKLLKSAGLDVGDYEVITGLHALRRYLKKNDNQWVKVSRTRGDMETFHSINYADVEPRLDKLENSLGAKKKKMEFIVEAGLAADVENVGYDGFTIDGKFASGSIVGIEVKGEAYLGRVMAYRDLPKQVRLINDKLKPTLREHKYRAFWSTDIICTKDGGAYLIDPCARAASPPSEVTHAMIDNLADIIWEGAAGIVVEPEFNARWGAELVLHSEWVEGNWLHLTFPEEIREHVKLRNVTVIDGEYYVMPQPSGGTLVGDVVATGNTADEAIAECKRIAELVRGHKLDKSLAALDKARESLAKVLGDKMDDTPPSKLEREARALHKAGHISDRQLAKITQSQTA